MRRLLAGLLLVLLVAPFGHADEGENGFLVGFAKADLTPKLPVYMGGYGAPMGRKATSVHDPIEARVCVLKHADRRTHVALVSLDFVGVSWRLTDDVELALRDTDIHIVLTATHTHASVGGLTDVPLWRPMMGPFDEALYLRTKDMIVDAIRRAIADLQPSVLSYAKGEVAGLQRNRRVANGPVDGSVRVLTVRGADGRRRGAFVGFAAHPTLLGVGNTELSAGWPGAMRASLETDWPHVLFFNGAMGDVSPTMPKWPADAKTPFAKVAAYGEAVASCVRGLIPSTEVIEPMLRVRSTTQSAATVAGRLLRKQDAALGARSHAQLRVRRIELTESLQLFTVPGEPTVETGRVIERAEAPLAPTDSMHRRRQSMPDTWVVSCAVDHLGYFADRDSFRRGGYEAEMSFFGPGAAQQLCDEAIPQVGWGSPWLTATSPVPLSPVFKSKSLGTPAYRLGYWHGVQLRDEIQDLLQAAEGALIRHAKQAGMDKVTLALSILGAGAVKPDDLIVPLLVRAARTFQPHIPAEYLDEMEGVADGARVSYDAILLLNTFLTITEQTNPTAMLNLPVRCTNVVAFGDATCMGQLLHGSTLDWGMGDVLRSRTRVMVFEPEEGLPFVSIGWPGMVGTLRAMNVHGVAITEESCAAPDDTRAAGMPLPFVLRRAVQYGESLPEAVDLVRKAPGTCGYKVTISDGHRNDARTVAVTATRSHVRKAKNGLLMGIEPDAAPERFESPPHAEIPRSDNSSIRRYEALNALIQPGHQCLRRSFLSWALSQRQGGILNKNTLLACVFEPGLLRFHVALGDDVPSADSEDELTWVSYDMRELVSRPAVQRHDPLLCDHTVDVTWTDMKSLLGTKRQRITFASPHASGHDFNDTVKAEYWGPKGDLRGIVIHLPAWKERTLAAHRFLAHSLSRKGIGTIILPLPYQHGRTAKGERPGQRTLSSNLAQTRNAILQGLVETRALAKHLRGKFPTTPIAVSGVSLGGHVAAVAYGAYPEAFDAGAFVLAGGNVIEAFVLPNSVTGRIQKELARRGVSVAEAFEMAREFEPLRFADPKRGMNVLIVAADEDDVVRPARAKALAKAYGDATIVWLDGGHYAPIRPDQAARLMNALGKHFTNVFGAK